VINGDGKIIWDAVLGLQQRMTAVETKIDSLPKSSDWTDLKVAIADLTATLRTLDVKEIQKEALSAIKESMVTKTDIRWLENHFWRGLAIVGSVEGGLILAVAVHIFTTH
jgi:cobyric acid synthase